MNSPGFHRVFTKFCHFTRFSPNKKKTWWIHQVFTKLTPKFKKKCWIHQVFNFTRFSQKKNLVNSPSFRQVFINFPNFTRLSSNLRNLVNSPGFHQVFTNFSIFTRFSPNLKSLVNSPGFHQVFTNFSSFTRFSPNLKNLVNSPGFHQVLPFHQVFTKLKKKTWWIHQVFTKFCHFTRFSPSLKKTWWIHQVFTNFSNFTRFSPNLKNLVNSPTRFSYWWFFLQISPPKRIIFTKISFKTLLLVNFRVTKRFLISDLVNFQKLGEFTKFSPGFHQVLKFHQIFTKLKKTWWIHQVFTKFYHFTRFSPN